MRSPCLACDPSTPYRSKWTKMPTAAAQRVCKVRVDPDEPMRALARVPRRSRPHPFAFRWSPAVSNRIRPLMRRSGWVLPLRQAAGLLASMADSVAPFRCPHGTALRGERRMRRPDLACDPSDIYVGASAPLLRATAQRRQGPGSSDGRSLTLRVCHRMAVGIRQGCRRLSAAKPLGSTLAGDDLDRRCLCAKLWARGLPWATA
jgi:hypothetical protein